jgi:hypothetical protein
MRIKTLLIALVVMTAAGATSAVRAQDLGDAMLTRMVSWFTGDPAVGEGPSPISAAPKNYAEDTCCADGACGCCSQCSKCYDTFGSVEFLMWWGRGTSLPPLVTTSLPGTARADAGILGLDSTSILFGDELATQKLQGGGRITAGIWLDPDHNVALGGRFFGLGGDTTRYSIASDGGPTDPIIARPFFNALLNGQEDAFLVSFPGETSGSLSANVTTNNIIGFDAFTEIMVSRDCLRRVDLVAGYQFFRLDDVLNVSSSSTFIDINDPLFGTQVDVRDQFRARNQFHGGQVGLRGRMARGMWSLNVLGVLGIGNMNQQVDINGDTVVTTGGVPSTTDGGILAQPTNSGTYSRNKFAFLPQLTTNLHYHVNPNLSFHIGYNILWISDIATSAQQIDRQVNPSQFLGGALVGPARPEFAFRDSDYWLQGINWGMNWDF